MSYATVSSPAGSIPPCIRHCSRIIVGDLYDRVRPVDQPYFQELRGKRLGTTDFAAFQAKAREKGVATFRAVLEPARRC